MTWIATDWIIYSSLGGIIHYYYLASLAPALAAAAGIGVSALWARYQERARGAQLLPLLFFATMVWQLMVQATAMNWSFESLWRPADAWPVELHESVVAVLVISCLGFFGGSYRKLPVKIRSPLASGSLALGMTALLVFPIVWSLSCVLLPAQGIVPSADLYRMRVVAQAPLAFFVLRFGQPVDTTHLVDFLEANNGNRRFLLTTSTTEAAAPIIIQRGAAVLARGGFHGLDRALDTDQLARMVGEDEIRFAMLGDVADVSRHLGADAAGASTSHWIKEHGTLVDPALWGGLRIVGIRPELYDLHPELGLTGARE